MSADGAEPAGNGPGPTRLRLLVALLCLIWGSTWLVIRTGLDDLPPLTSAGVRFAIAFAVLCALAPRLARREGGARPRPLVWVVVGTLNFALSYAIVYTSETVLPSGLVSVLWAVFPLMMAVAGHGWLDERLRAGQWGGMLLGFGGVALLFATDLRTASADAIPMALFLLLSPLVSVVGQTVLKRHGSGASSVLVNRNAMGLGAAQLLFAAWLLERDEPAAWTPNAIFSIVYLALVGTVVSFTLYFWLLRYAKATTLSVIAYVTPVVALTLGCTVGGEPLTTASALGSALVVTGVALAVVSPRGARARRNRRISST